EEGYGDGHDDGGRDHVVARRPVHLLHFDAHVVQELAQPPRIFRDFGYRSRKRKRCALAARIFLAQFRRLSHLAGRLCFLELTSLRPPAPLAAKLAGEEGFEPPLSVLETDGLPLNLLP